MFSEKLISRYFPPLLLLGLTGYHEPTIVIFRLRGWGRKKHHPALINSGADSGLSREKGNSLTARFLLGILGGFWHLDSYDSFFSSFSWTPAFQKDISSVMGEGVSSPWRGGELLAPPPPHENPGSAPATTLYLNYYYHHINFTFHTFTLEYFKVKNITKKIESWQIQVVSFGCIGCWFYVFLHLKHSRILWCQARAPMLGFLEGARLEFYVRTIKKKKFFWPRNGAPRRPAPQATAWSAWP
jgi:hypothetical protein